MSMPLSDLVALWETKTKECNHTQVCWRGDNEQQLFLMNKVLAERAPESLYVLAGRIQGTENGFVIWEAMDVLRLVDEYRMRVGQVEAGKKLIQTIAAQLDFTNTTRLLPVGFLQIGLTHHKELEWRQERQAELAKLRSGANGIAP